MSLAFWLPLRVLATALMLAMAIPLLPSSRQDYGKRAISSNPDDIFPFNPLKSNPAKSTQKPSHLPEEKWSTSDKDCVKWSTKLCEAGVTESCRNLIEHDY